VETAVTADFADGSYRFWLPLPQIFELERNCGSMLALEERLRVGIGLNEAGEAEFVGGGAAIVKEITETIRLALIGGNSGMVQGEEREIGPLEAKRLVENYVYPARPLAEGAALAWRILSTAIFGVRLKKKVSGEADSTASSTKDKSSQTADS
jgi:hypothetical protein